MRHQNDPSEVRVLLDYCGLLPPQNVTVEMSSNSQIGNVKYVSEYNLGSRTVIPRATVSALKDDDIIV